ncbi:nucleotidyltransferase domain-containing protein, partial [Geoalkalibacter halelectricus]|uniref:nucleotidyltransferase domain-containing protein n=1 Tax=Geoalkalibacter halelectricus TaxID=2847045 RepID=UPI003D1ECBA5
MDLAEDIKSEIVEKLKAVDPEKIILFGSRAWGRPSAESDIDLYVVTKDNFMPQTWSEKNRVYLKVARALQEIVRQYPTDLIVHTRPMHQKFMEMNSSFAREIAAKGQKLYECQGSALLSRPGVTVIEQFDLRCARFGWLPVPVN